MLVIQVDEDVSMHPVAGKQDEDNEIGDQQREIETVDVVETAKGRVEKMLADVRTDAFGSARYRAGREGNRLQSRQYPIRIQQVPRWNFLFYRIRTKCTLTLVHQ